MSENGVCARDLVVLCDGESDVRLFRRIKACHPRLQGIPDTNVRAYEQARNVVSPTALARATQLLHQDDRPDFIFCHGDAPVLVTELTRHAYTGDNGLQRFARAAAAAENGVPFIYFGPLARVRDDELDGDRNASARNLTSDVFEGMERLAAIHGSPQIVVEWKTNASGLPRTLPACSSDADVAEIFSSLLDAMALLLFEAPLCTAGRPLSNTAVRELQASTARLATRSNTRFSDVKFLVETDELRRLLLSFSAVLPRMQGTNYFAKGKPDKTLAEYAIREAKPEFVQYPDGSVSRVSPAQLQEVVNRVLSQPKFRSRSLCFYTGYKWRSDPHCGVLVNLDYRLCRRDGERRPMQRSTGLTVLYPRVSLRRDSRTAHLLGELRNDIPTGLRQLFVARYGADADEKMEMCLRSAKLFGVWGNGTKQARIFRRYADLVVLNDGLVLGDSLIPLFS
ncbi:hypothetical protein [Pseudoroseomonas cervicalis]|uniref:hypothetical protein n=1 Tax=Teichococcus cervicalis TaxID=204525 RepID=UPI0022F196AE|nr:hypothetical protein [Pseudoroseomonas cervicalis]WBV43528.1 hypothetical protein PFY06_02860 [Pseudoroseomonas cervicalis]